MVLFTINVPMAPIFLTQILLLRSEGHFYFSFFFTKDSLKVQQTAGEICGMKEKYSLRLIFSNLNASLK